MNDSTLSTTSTDIASLPLKSAREAFAGCQQAVVVAPHPDDETLGCGGAIALLRQRSIPVNILVMSDGTGSHPSSQLYPPPRLRRLRELETCEALGRLGVDTLDVTFLRLSDTSIPHPGTADFPTAVERCRHYLYQYSPSILFVPWRSDQHCDHRATWHIVQSCLQDWEYPPQQLVYSIWGSSTGGLRDLPTGEWGWRLDIRSVVDLKRYAVAAHQSQTTDLINDDAGGFCLTSEMLFNLIQPWETYLQVTS